MKVTQDPDEYTIMAEINMIPFIDICLVLLIIFMVMTPLLVQSQISVKLPSSVSAEAAKPDRETVTVEVRKDGAVFVDGKEIASDQIEKTMREKLPDAKEQSVIVEADRDVPFKFVVDVMGVAKKLDVGKMGVSVIEKKSR